MFNFCQTQAFSLFGAGATVGDTTLRLKTFKKIECEGNSDVRGKPLGDGNNKKRIGVGNHPTKPD